MGSISLAAIGLLAASAVGSANAATIYSLPDKSLTVQPGITVDSLVSGSSLQDGHFVSAVQINDNTTTEHGLYYGYDVRRQANGDEYMTRLITGPNNTVVVNLSKIKNGVTSGIVSKDTGVKFIAGQRLILDTVITGTSSVQINEIAYIAGTAKPAAQLVYTDTAADRIATAGAVGVTAYTSTASAAQSITYSKFQAIDHTATSVGVTTPTIVKATPTTVKSTPTTAKSTPTTVKTTPTTVKATTTTTAKPAATAAVGDVNALLANSTGTLNLGAGTYTFSDFAQSSSGVSLGTRSLVGAGSSKTILSMKANSSTKKSSVPTASGTTNQLYVLRSLSGSPTLSGFTLMGNAQGHLYNSLMVGRTTNAKISDVKVVGYPGNASAPPGETFGANDYDTTNSVWSNIEIDGQGQGAAAFGTNGSKNVTINGLYSHDSPFSAGITYWETNGGTLSDYKDANVKKGINMEQDTGTYVFNRPQFGSNSEGVDLSTFSTLGSVKVTINDPVLTAGQKIRIQPFTGATAYGGKNVQVKSDIKVMVNGVDKTSSLVTWLS